MVNEECMKIHRYLESKVYGEDDINVLYESYKCLLRARELDKYMRKNLLKERVR